MGIDFYICARCGDTFADCGHYINCNDCYNHWCSEQCAKEDGWRVDEEETYGNGIKGDDDEYGMEAAHSCKFCRVEDTTDHILFSFLLTKLGLTRAEVLEQWLVSLKAK